MGAFQVDSDEEEEDAEEQEETKEGEQVPVQATQSIAASILIPPSYLI